MDGYDVAQICLNGHVITENARRFSQHQKAYCPKCGKATIMNCPNCSAPIQGEYHVDGTIRLGAKEPIAPSFCHNCGKPYPWTESQMQAFNELINEDEGLSEEDKNIANESLKDLISENPKTQLAATRMKKILGKVGATVGQSVKSILIAIATEEAKRMIGLP